MQSLTHIELKEKQKKTLRRLSIWDDVKREIDALLGQIESDVTSYSDSIKQVSDKVDRLPNLITDGKRKVHPCKQHIIRDTIKLYYRNEAGELVIENVSQSDDRPTKTSTTTTSIDLLKSKPTHGELVFAKVNEQGPWTKCKITSVFHKSVNGRPMTTFKLVTLTDDRVVTVGKYEVARIQDHGKQLRAPKRVVAGFDESSMESGIIAQDPDDKLNKNRYMVFLDNGTCKYFKPDQVCPIFYQSPVPWTDLRQLGNRDKRYLGELCKYFESYPKRILLAATVGQKINIYRDGERVPCELTKIDHDVIVVAYNDRVEESIHRGSPRLMKTMSSLYAKKDVPLDKLYDKLLGNMRRYHSAGSTALGEDYLQFVENFQDSVTICGSNKARKSTGARSGPQAKLVKLDGDEVFDDRDQLPYIRDLAKVWTTSTKHKCDPQCLTRSRISATSASAPSIKLESDVADIVEHYRDTSDLKVPLLLGWKRQLVKAVSHGRTKKQFIYQAPCGRIFQNMHFIKSYLLQTKSKFDIDYFSLDDEIILNRPLGERPAYHYEKNIAFNRTTGKIIENKFISLVNPINEEHLPLDFEYRSDSFPHPMLRNFSFNTEFKSGCDCEDDCNTIANCACHRLTEQAAGISAYSRKTRKDKKCHYVDKRLNQQVMTGIFECNSFCKCSSKCPNRVVQNGIRIRMQLRKTVDKGWGVFVLDDVPKGAFIATYSAELLDDANQYGDSDMYFADLDFVSVVETQKLDLDSDDDEGLEMDEDEREGKGTKRPMSQDGSSDEDSPMSSSSLSSSRPSERPQASGSKGRAAKEAAKSALKAGGKAQQQQQQKPQQQFRKFHSVLGDPTVYTLDARMQGNIGRFFNHSCDPNSMVQNVFIETHDLRFPVVAYFSRCALKADDEINWNYNYCIDSIEGRQIDCNCGAANCKGRIL